MQTHRVGDRSDTAASEAVVGRHGNCRCSGHCLDCGRDHLRLALGGLALALALDRSRIGDIKLGRLCEDSLVRHGRGDQVDLECCSDGPGSGEGYRGRLLSVGRAR